ncbi:MAG TPA: ABC transporter permease, partial [Chitinophagales bacterium]|nr:ABC transporter permease [Chitinophagales bacterium]
MAILLKIFWQSLVMSFEEIRAAKLRSFLSLLGITIGILCIISVRTAVSSLQINIENSLASFGNDILYIQKWPWTFTADYPWWKYINRPSANRRELEQLQQKVTNASALCLLYFGGETNAVSGGQTAEGVKLLGISNDYEKIKELEFTQGRYFTPGEFKNGQAVALIGASVADNLFGGITQIEGRDIKVNGVKLKVIGVLKKEGSDIFGFTLDDNVIVPYTFISMIINTNDIGNDPLIAATPQKGLPLDELKYELRGAMRSIRRLSPFEDDNFAINNVNVFAETLSSVLSFINVVGIIIGGFSVFVGGFGIANIMFVAVKERTYIIGIKKAIGAKKVYILLEFLLEAVVLCLVGGVIGLLVVLGLFAVIQYLVVHVWQSNFHFYITAFNVILGISISVVVGILAGFIPAFIAANMKPVDAIR